MDEYTEEKAQAPIPSRKELKDMAASLQKDDVSELQLAQQILENALAKRYKTGHGIDRGGKMIRVPEHMDLEDAADAITSYLQEMEEDEQTLMELEAHPYDACYAFHHAVSDIYGNLTSRTTMGFFGPNPGKSFIVPIDHENSIKIPVGSTKVPGLPIHMDIHVTDPHSYDPGDVGVRVVYSCKKKYTPLLKDIEEAAKKFLRTNSIFLGKAIDSGYEFLNIDSFNPDQVVYSADQELQLNANVFTVIEQTQKAIAANIPIKRGILLHGPYGTGKTLTALMSARKCVANGWTFILVRGNDNIEKAIGMAQKYQPACVFFEDIDAKATETRDDDVNGILNSIDGILSKDSQVMTILTTNHIEKINPAMLRPGRLDAVIRLGELDKQGVIKFIEATAVTDKGASMIKGELDPDSLYEAAKGYVPAFIKEAVSKATLYAIAREGSNKKTVKITNDDIVAALTELRPQYEMMTMVRKEKVVSMENYVKGMIDERSADQADMAVNEHCDDRSHYDD